MKPNKAVVYMVVGTLAFAVIAYVAMLYSCAVQMFKPDEDILTAFKDLAIFASGALAALLSRTGSTPESQDVTVVNPPSNPANVEVQPNAVQP